MNLQAVIFDMDGVLLDTEKYLVECWILAAKELGFSMKREHALYIRSLAAEYARPYFKSVFGDTFDYTAVRNRRKELMEQRLLEEGIPKKPGADQLLSYLKQKGIKCAVATATDEKRARRYLKAVDLLPYFDRIVCAPMVSHGKPAPDLYLYACRQLGERPEDCIAVEDSPNGVRSAYDAGLWVIMTPDLTQPDEELSKLLYKKANSLEQIVEILEEKR